jgi:hypothetical protein
MSDAHDHTFAEFFAGIGLMRIGLERAGWRIAFANDIDEDKWQMYRHNFGNTGEFVVGDVHQLDVVKVPSVSVTFVVISPPPVSMPTTSWRLSGMPLAGTPSSFPQQFSKGCFPQNEDVPSTAWLKRLSL